MWQIVTKFIFLLVGIFLALLRKIGMSFDPNFRKEERMIDESY